MKVYTERMTYGFTATRSTTLAAAVPAGAASLLLTAFPDLTDAQRTAILAQTQSASGNVLDRSGVSNAGSWQRLNLAAATSATVRINADRSVTVLSVGGPAKVIKAGDGQTPTPAPSSPSTGSSAPSTPSAPVPSHGVPATSASGRPGLPSTGV